LLLLVFGDSTRGGERAGDLADDAARVFLEAWFTRLDARVRLLIAVDGIALRLEVSAGVVGAQVDDVGASDHDGVTPWTSS